MNTQMLLSAPVTVRLTNLDLTDPASLEAIDELARVVALAEALSSALAEALAWDDDTFRDLEAPAVDRPEGIGMASEDGLAFRAHLSFLRSCLDRSGVTSDVPRIVRRRADETLVTLRQSELVIDLTEDMIIA